MDERALRQAARELVAEAAMQSAITEAAEASGWVVVSTDLETGRLHLTGPHETAEAALFAAAAEHEQVNRGLGPGEKGWSHTVWPLFPPSG